MQGKFMEESILVRIYDSVLKFLIKLDLSETCSTVVDEAIKLVGGDDGALLLERDGKLVKIYNSSSDIASVKTRENGFSMTAFTKKKSFMVNYDQLKKAHPEADFGNLRSAIFIPLSNRKKSIGTLIVRSLNNGKQFSKSELEILNLFGSMASLAIVKAELYQEMETALTLRDRFISMAAHELRTPLTSIHGYSQLLAKKLGNNSSNESRWSQQLAYECTRLKVLITDLLEISRIRAGRINYSFKECQIKEVIDRTINNFHFMYPDRKLSFEDKMGKQKGILIGDFDKLLQVIVNLLDNAAKFSPVDAVIDLCLRESDKGIKIIVQDHGVGIKESELEKVKESFFIGSNHNREGMGLGLFLVREIITAHHGEVAIKSKERAGTKIEISLPLQKYD